MKKELPKKRNFYAKALKNTHNQPRTFKNKKREASKKECRCRILK